MESHYATVRCSHPILGPRTRPSEERLEFPPPPWLGYSTLHGAGRVLLQPIQLLLPSGVNAAIAERGGPPPRGRTEVIIWHHEEAGIRLFAPNDHCFVAGREWRKSQLLPPQPNLHKTVWTRHCSAQITKLHVMCGGSSSSQGVWMPPECWKAS